MGTRKRVLFYVIVIILPLAPLGCQKRVAIARPLNVVQSKYDKAAPVILEACDPARHASLFKSGSESGVYIRLLCAAGMKEMEEPLSLGKIQNNELKKLILKYKETGSKEVPKTLLGW